MEFEALIRTSQRSQEQEGHLGIPLFLEILLAVPHGCNLPGVRGRVKLKGFFSVTTVDDQCYEQR